MNDVDRVKLESFISSKIIESFQDITRSELSFHDLQDIADGISKVVTIKVEKELVNAR